MNDGRKRVVFRCEACGCALKKRNSYLSHQFLRHDVYVCENPLCSASYAGTSELTHIASPSGVPEAQTSELPPTPAYVRNQAQAAWRAQHVDAQADLFAPSTDAAPLAPANGSEGGPCNP